MTDKKRTLPGMNVVKKMFEQDTQTTLDKAYKGLVEDIADIQTRLPEEVFVKHFLPFFAGKETVENRPTVISEWIGIAGTPGSEVRVVDQVGQELFIVPAIYDTSYLTFQRTGGGTDVDQLLDHARLISSNIPSSGDRFITEALSDKLTRLNSPVPSVVNEQRWISIFERYGLVEKKTSPSSGQPSTNNNITDDEVYD